MQIFEVLSNKTTKSVSYNNTVKEFLSDKEIKADSKVFLLVDDNKKMIWLYKGKKSALILQFIGAELQKKLKIQLKGFYSTKDLYDIPVDSNTYEEIMNSKISKSGRAKEITEESEQEDDNLTEKQKQVKQEIEASRAKEICVHKDVVPQNVISKLLERNDIPMGFHRHMTLIGSGIYTEEIMVDRFLVEKKEKVMLKKIGNIPNGFFFIEDLPFRLIMSKNKVEALDFIISDDKFLGANKLMVPILFKDRFLQEQDMNSLLNAFKKIESSTNNE